MGDRRISRKCKGNVLLVCYAGIHEYTRDNGINREITEGADLQNTTW